MKDIDILIKYSGGTELRVNTDMIWEDVIRLRMGLEPQEQN